jgi:uncharacterized protein with ATP-grasp and redox domains
LGLRPGEECIRCFSRGFSDYVDRAGLSLKDYDRFTALIFDNLRRGITPPLAGAEAWELLRTASLSGEDIFSAEKKLFTDKLLSVYDELRNRFSGSVSPAMEALSAATWCNLLDVGQGNPLPGTEELSALFHKPLAVDKRSSFLKELNDADILLILGDNAGETVMDRLFLELSGFRGKRYYMTRERPVMNDALTEDAVQAGLHNEAEILPSGTDLPAVVPDMLQGKPLEVFQTADVILAKGQGNLEGLFGSGDPRIYHSFVVKCPVVSRAVGTPVGEGVFGRFTERDS